MLCIYASNLVYCQSCSLRFTAERYVLSCINTENACTTDKYRTFCQSRMIDNRDWVVCMIASNKHLIKYCCGVDRKNEITKYSDN